MENFILFLQIIYPVVMLAVTIGTIVFGGGRVVQKVADQKEASNKADQALSNRLDAIERMIPELVKQGRCDIRHHDFEKAMFKKIDEIRECIEAMETKREESAKENEKRWNDIFKAVGRLEGIINGKK